MSILHNPITLYTIYIIYVNMTLQQLHIYMYTRYGWYRKHTKVITCHEYSAQPYCMYNQLYNLCIEYTTTTTYLYVYRIYRISIYRETHNKL